MHKKTVIDFKALGQRLIFDNPIKELIARDLKEVEAVLKQVEDFQEQGYYVPGYLSYEAAPAFEEKFACKREALAGEYLAYFTVHDQVTRQPLPQNYEEVAMPETWSSRTSQQDYEAAIAHIREQIRQGNTYQVNYTIQLESQLEAAPWLVYNRLVVEQKAAYNAYIAHDDFAVLSVSPELFFEKNGQQLITRPMKGTTNRRLDYASDQAARAWLAQDTKNRAENMMIADLLRNDMGRISEIGSVKVTQLCQVEQYSTVWQMTSTIESKLLPDMTLLNVFKALYPCGSITGAPKIATMKVIDDLEPAPRGVYCGTVGLCLPNGRAIFNVPIRTLQVQERCAIYGVGGGITWDSQAADEFEETKQKSAVLTRQAPKFDLITTGKISQGKLFLKDKHLQRLQEASSYFAYPFDAQDFEQLFEQVLQKVDLDKDYRLKFSLTVDGQLTYELADLADLPASMQQARVVVRSSDLASPFFYFKTSQRQHLTSKGESIFVSADGYLQETSIANLVLEIDGQCYTPSKQAGLLPGLYRQYLLETGQLIEKDLRLEDLVRADKVYACNSVRGLYPLEIIED